MFLVLLTLTHSSKVLWPKAWALSNNCRFLNVTLNLVKTDEIIRLLVVYHVLFFLWTSICACISQLCSIWSVSTFVYNVAISTLHMVFLWVHTHKKKLFLVFLWVHAHTQKSFPWEQGIQVLVICHQKKAKKESRRKHLGGKMMKSVPDGWLLWYHFPFFSWGLQIHRIIES